MFWKKFTFNKKKSIEGLNVFLLRAELSFKTVAQVSYKDEYANVKIVRFYDKSWSREIISFSENLEDICFKFFAHSPNLTRNESLEMRIEQNGEVLLSQVFRLDKNDDFTGWCELTASSNKKL
jgi:hypothetical protein